MVTESIIDLWRETNKEISLTVKGTSMEPLLKEGDEVTVDFVMPDQLKRGDMIAFRQNGCVIVHRLVRKRKSGGTWLYCQKGDNLNGWGWIPEDMIIGKVSSLKKSGHACPLPVGERASVRGNLNDFWLSFYWRWLNLMMGLWGSVYVFLYEGLNRTKRTLCRKTVG